MMIDSNNWQSVAARSINPADWTVVIPAAGRGSRLGFDLPKILYPIGGRTILDWLACRFRPYAARFVLVLSPEGAPVVQPVLESLLPGSFEIVVQHTPTGMGDAVDLGLRAVLTPFTAIVWGDQVCLRDSSVAAVMRVHSGPLAPVATVPTVFTSPPYIHFSRDTNQNLNGLLQAREGDFMPSQGESDTGFFCFSTPALRGYLGRLRSSGKALGRKTREFNFLPVIPLIAQHSGTVLTPHLMAPEEAIGINSRSDAERVEAFLGSAPPHD